jgi:hypothetical protein
MLVFGFRANNVMMPSISAALCTLPAVVSIASRGCCGVGGQGGNRDDSHHLQRPA